MNSILYQKFLKLWSLITETKNFTHPNQKRRRDQQLKKKYNQFTYLTATIT